MIRFECEWCKRLKSSDEIWILGLAAEAVGITSARREISILPTWNRDNSVHPLAVHFCSHECKDDYMARLFEKEPPVSPEIVIEEKTTARAVPRRRRTMKKKRNTRRKQAA
ncbi:MAG TPA: hypothetical protein VFI95_02085 [Terriglobales bacterium]|nr:hypothetical protein [Terriglobales bacterium]